jgi:prephenate dehydrogenase
VTRVHVIGTGLLGTSLGLALRRVGDDVTLEDISPTHAALARDLGAGRLAESAVPGDGDAGFEPDLVVVATPPDVTAAVVARALTRWPTAFVTDLASVKGAVVNGLRATSAPTSPATADPTRWRVASAPVPCPAATTCSTGARGC